METERVVGVSRYVTNPGPEQLRVLAGDCRRIQWLGIGVAHDAAIMDVALSRGLARVKDLVPANNASLLKMVRGLDFEIKKYDADPDFRLYVCVRSAVAGRA